jgi:hypothetical protein
MKQIFLVSVFVILAFIVTNCNNDESDDALESGTSGVIPPDTDGINSLDSDSVTASDTSDSYSNPYSDNIIGRWKLVEVSIYKNIHEDHQQTEIINYLDSNVIYDFYENNKLVITGNINLGYLSLFNDFQEYLLLIGDFQEGTHFYTYGKPNYCPTCLPGPNMTIDDPEFIRGVSYYCVVELKNGRTMRIIADKNIGGVKNGPGLIVGGNNYRWVQLLTELD